MKAGIDFFPLDVHLDDKWKLIEAEFGLKGFAIVVKLHQKIYGEQGYYGEWNDDVALLFAQTCSLTGGSAVSEIINAATKRGIFDCNMYDKYGILTSTGIQKRYFEAIKRRKEITVVKEYLLFDIAHFLKDVNINWKNVNTNGENVCIFQQSKVEKSKVKNSKESSVSADNTHTHFVKPTVEKIRAYCEERGNNVDAQRFFDFYESKGWLVGRTPMQDWRACVRNWEKNNTFDVKQTSTQQTKVLIGGRDMERRPYTQEELNALFTPLDDGED